MSDFTLVIESLGISSVKHWANLGKKLTKIQRYRPKITGQGIILRVSHPKWPFNDSSYFEQTWENIFKLD